MTSKQFKALLNECLHEVNASGELIDPKEKFLYSHLNVNSCNDFDFELASEFISTPWIKFERAEDNTYGLPKTNGYYIINLFDKNAIYARLLTYKEELLLKYVNHEEYLDIYFNIPIIGENGDIIRFFCQKYKPLEWRLGDYPFEDSDKPYYGYHLFIKTEQK